MPIGKPMICLIPVKNSNNGYSLRGFFDILKWTSNTNHWRKNMKNISLFCWNIANPSIERAKKQAEWIQKRADDFFILTEAKGSEGCIFLKKYFQAYGYNVIIPKMEKSE